MSNRRDRRNHQKIADKQNNALVLARQNTSLQNRVDSLEKQLEFLSKNALHELEKRVTALWEYHIDSMELMAVDSAIRGQLQGLDTSILATRIGAAQRVIRKDDLLSLSDQLSVDMNRFQFLADKLKLAPDIYQGFLSEISRYREGIRRFCNDGDGGAYLEQLALERDPGKQRFVEWRNSLEWGGKNEDDGIRCLLDLCMPMRGQKTWSELAEYWHKELEQRQPAAGTKEFEALLWYGKQKPGAHARRLRQEASRLGYTTNVSTYR